MKQTNNELKNGLLDLFCGPGGMSLGFMQAGYEIILSNDIDQHAIETIRYNHQNIAIANGKENFHCALQADVRNLNPEKISKYFNSKGYRIQGIIGGPPCKGFSRSNQRTRGPENPHNRLFEGYINLVESLNPDFFVFENVDGILSFGKGKVIQEIWKRLHENSNYLMATKMLCAQDYGVPQARKRVILLGISSNAIKKPFIKENNLNTELSYPKPTTEKPTTIKEAFSGLPPIPNGNKELIMKYLPGGKSNYAKLMIKMPELNMASNNVLNHLNSKNSDLVINRYKTIPPGGNWKDIPNELLSNYKDKSRCHSAIYHRFNENEVCVTLNNIRKSMYIHPRENRNISVREGARIQSFPDWYEFKGPLLWQQQMVADAVPPLMAKAIAQHLKSMLKTDN